MAPHAHAPAAPSAERAPPIVSRRPVLDRTLRTVGFELIFRDGAAAPRPGAAELDPHRHPAYLSVTSQYLVACEPLPLEPAGCWTPCSRAAETSAFPDLASHARTR